MHGVVGEMSADVGATVLPALVASGAVGGLLLAGPPLLRRLHLSLHLMRRAPRYQLAPLTVVLGAAVALLVMEGWGGPGERTPRLCNGRAELCDRAFDEVVFAGTHNGMSAANLGWVFPNHDRWIRAQLAAGYRALLLDVHYWSDHEELRPYLERFPPEYRTALEVALRQAGPARPGVFLCHALCRLGATPLVQGLREIARFLGENPNEVVVLSLEDYASPEDVQAAFRDAGLMPLVYTPSGDGSWPTLNAMIESGQRLVVFVDHHGGEPAWYQRFRTNLQDTPFNVRRPSDFTCGRNRGAQEAPLLLINHWISTPPPDRVNASLVNRYGSVSEHVERCLEDRGMRPSIIAVDFFAIGDVVEVVDDLNAGAR
jgi:hypothetical protein